MTNCAHPTGSQSQVWRWYRLGTISNKHFGHSPPVLEGKIIITVDMGCSFSVDLSVKEFTNSDIANGLRFPLSLKL